MMSAEQSALGRAIVDGASSPLFSPLALAPNLRLEQIAESGLSDVCKRNAAHAPLGDCVCWGVPFHTEGVLMAEKEPVRAEWKPIQARWLLFLHTADVKWLTRDAHGFFREPAGIGRLREHLADYVILYADGSSERVPIHRRHQIGMVWRGWGENCFEAVAPRRPFPSRTTTEQPRPGMQWGWAQTRVTQPDADPWCAWVWAWRNPHPDRAVTGLLIEPRNGTLLLHAVSAGQCAAHPLRWERRRKAILTLPEGAKLQLDLDYQGQHPQIRLDLGQVISVLPRPVYPNEGWADSVNNQPPAEHPREALVEYTAAPDARFHLADGIQVSETEVARGPAGPLTPVAPAHRRVTLRVVEREGGKPVPVKLHLHGEAGEYLAPVDRARIPNPFWYEDWSCDFVHADSHFCTYIPGHTVVDLPLGRVYVEISKGFEIKPIRKVVEVGPETEELTFTLERVLPWRSRGWVTADTHVHFLSPTTAELEGAAEGVNVINLLASQWGELMTNVGDYDGRTTHGSREAGGEGEYLVRVGTENRQHVLGHISLLGYSGPIIAPMTVAGPDEAALGDPVDVLLIEWARQCRKQGGLVVLPHFPNPRAEHAAALVEGEIDGVEMTSWGNLYAGIDPYSLSDWYRYLNNGYFVPAVAGTDKMAASTPVGAIRTYARLPEGRAFDYEGWMAAVRSGNTFATYGPLVEFAVEGKAAGQRIGMGKSGGTVNVTWELASCTVPMTRVDLVVNGEIRQSAAVDPHAAQGHWAVRIEKSSWLALLVRGRYPERPEMIAAHTSPVVVEVADSPFFAAADALSILHQIEGAMAYLETIGTRADEKAYQRMRLTLTSAYRTLHNRLHKEGVFHDHLPATAHADGHDRESR